MKKLLSILFLAFMASTVSMAQCEVIDMVISEARQAVSNGNTTHAINLLQKAIDNQTIRDLNCSNYSRLAEEKRRIEAQQSSTGQNLTITANGVTFTMVAVQGGTFTMGATSEQGSDAYSNEKPAHRVTLSDYYIGQTEVTQALWQAVMGSNPSERKGQNLPVEKVSWDDCQQFITKLNQLTGRRFRLPTEAEWEYAARGGNLSRGYKYVGGNTLTDVAWFWENSGDKRVSGEWSSDKVYNNHCKSHPVKQKVPNELGIYDMAGNVWEWCQDLYDKDYYSKSPSTNPCNNSSANERVNRGGCWFLYASCCRVSWRGHMKPNSRYGNIGLRVAM